MADCQGVFRMFGVPVIGFGLLGFAISWSLIPLILRHTRPCGRRQLHQTHDHPVSRFGGLAIALASTAVGVAGLWFASGGAGPIRLMLVEGCLFLASALAMFLLGFIDDRRPLGAKLKLSGQVAIASAIFLVGLNADSHLAITSLRNPVTLAEYPLGLWSYPATVLWLVGFTNLVNLIDGVDGLAAGVCLLVSALLVFVAVQSGLLFSAVCAAGLCGALLAFLFFNFPPAAIYLGDGGAYFLGFTLGLLSMLQSHKGTVAAALIAPLFVLALPITDVTLAIVRRGLAGIPIFRPDQRHIHHRLAQAGLSRIRIVLIFYSCSAFFLLLSLGVFVSRGRWIPILFGIGCLLLLLAARSFSFSRDWFALGKVLGNSLEVRQQNRYALALQHWFELDARHAKSPEELWEDFGFLCYKLGFAKVTIVTPDARKHWRNPGARLASPPWRCRRFDLPFYLNLTFTASESVLNSTAFEFMSELAADTWLQATGRWQSTHRAAFRFQSVLPNARPRTLEMEGKGIDAADGG